MPYTPHEVEKLQKIANLAVGLVEQDMTLAKIVNHAGVDEFKGAQDDKIIARVPGRLPGREYAWRNDRSTELVVDVYKEATTEITFGGHAYSAVEVTDEQMEFDLQGWAKLLTAQSAAVGNKLHSTAASLITDAPYTVTVGLGGNETELQRGILALRGYLNQFRVPREGRYLVVGTDVETQLLLDDKFVKASNTSEGRAEDALANASIGRIYGFSVIVDQTIDADVAYAFVASGFVLRTASKAIPQSVGFGATASYEGFALRWMRQYEPRKLQELSVVDCWVGSNHVEDLYIPRAVDAPFDPSTLKKHFVRGIKLTMSGASAKKSGIADLESEVGTVKLFKPAADPTPDVP